jgi:hypothetical protein
MSKFIRFTNLLVNTANIIKVDILPNKYILFMSSNNISGVFIAGSGGLLSYDNKITICKMEQRYDYLVMEKWINQIKMDVYKSYSDKI